MALTIAVDDPGAKDVQDLLAVHLAFCHTSSPPEYSHALDAVGLLDPALTVVSAREDSPLLGIGAIKQLSAAHGEVKSMHTREAARGRGVGRAILVRLLALASERGYRQVSLETGTTPHFAAARALYADMGFTSCAPFSDYVDSPYNTFMTIWLDTKAPRPMVRAVEPKG